jgi:mannose-6-phosphate isomerase-like protein (cupin superfamily)
MIKRLGLLFLLANSFLLVRSDEPTPQGFVHWPAASLASMAQSLSAEAAANPVRPAIRQLASFSNEYFLLAHREADGTPELHETEADIFVVRSGAATLLVGGTLVNSETISPHEKRNGIIQGGIRQKLAPGDVVRIPPGMPHQLLLDGAHDFTYFVVKVKGY